MAKKSGKGKKQKKHERAVSKPSEYAHEINKSSLATEPVSPSIADVSTIKPERAGSEFSRNKFMEEAGLLLSIAAGIGILMAFFTFVMPHGDIAISAFGGLNIVPVQESSARWAFFLDMVFPVFYGSGLALLFVSCRARQNRPLIRMALTALLVLVVADFAENAMIFKAISDSNQSIAPSVIWPFTSVKYGSVALASVLLSTLLETKTSLGRLVVFAARYVFPILIAMLIAGIGGGTAQQLISTSFPLFLILLALFAYQKTG